MEAGASCVLPMQTQDSNRRIRLGEIPRYKGIVDCFQRIIKDEGVAALWRGNFRWAVILVY